jgi:hypothetical protein
VGFLCGLLFSALFCLVAVSQTSLEENRELIDGIAGFEDSVRKCKLRH